jgi:hypothetical protein
MDEYIVYGLGTMRVNTEYTPSNAEVSMAEETIRPEAKNNKYGILAISPI